MSGIGELLEQFGKGHSHDGDGVPGKSWIWLGETPQPFASAIRHIIAPLGYTPTAADKFSAISPADAAVWLPMLAFGCMIHPDFAQPADDVVSQTMIAFGELGPEAQFFSNGEFQYTRRGRHWETAHAGGPWMAHRRYDLSFGGNVAPELPSQIRDGYVTDGGIVGIGRNLSFCFWVMEDD